MALVDGILQAEKLSESSKTHYLEKLATLSRLVGQPVDWIIDHPNKVVAAIRRRYTCPLTQRAFVSAVKAVFHHNPELKETKPRTFQQFTEYQNEMSQAINERYMAAQPSEKEQRNWVPWPDVLAKEQELAHSEYGSYDHLLLAMYCLIEPLRQDYGTLKILVDKLPPEDSTGNYLAVASNASWGKLILNTYKTAKNYGVFQRDLPADLLAVIRANLLAHPRAYLFVDENGLPYKKKNSFTQFSNRTLRRLFGKNFTVSLMRHSHISNIDFNASTPGELFAKSRNMAHSISMQQMYRRKVDPLPPITVVKQPAAVPVAPSPPPASAPGVVTDADGQRFLQLSV